MNTTRGLILNGDHQGGNPGGFLEEVSMAGIQTGGRDEPEAPALCCSPYSHPHPQLPANKNLGVGVGVVGPRTPPEAPHGRLPCVSPFLIRTPVSGYKTVPPAPIQKTFILT